MSVSAERPQLALQKGHRLKPSREGRDGMRERSEEKENGAGSPEDEMMTG